MCHFLKINIVLKSSKKSYYISNLFGKDLLWEQVSFFHYYDSFIFFISREKEEENSWTSKHIHMPKLTCHATLLLYILASHLLCALCQFSVEEPYVSEPSLKYPAYLWILKYQLSHLNWAKELWWFLQLGILRN